MRAAIVNSFSVLSVPFVDHTLRNNVGCPRDGSFHVLTIIFKYKQRNNNKKITKSKVIMILSTYL